MARYIAAGCAIVNDIKYADGSRANGFLGGTLYTLNGIIPYTDDALLVVPAGPDFDSLYGDYFRRNGLSQAGIECILEKTQYTLLEYNEQGQWWEHSIYGPEYDGVPDSEPKAEHIIKHGGDDVLGIYSEVGIRYDFWDKLDEMRKACPNAKIMWEIFTPDLDYPELIEPIKELISKIDIYSINRPEAQALFGTNSEEKSIEAIKELGKPCFFRVGSKGSYMIQDGEAWFVPSVESETSVDSTGCGNCSTGAAMYGWCEGFHPARTAAYANVAAGVNARQVGPFPHYSAEVKKEMIETAEALYRKVMDK